MSSPERLSAERKSGSEIPHPKVVCAAKLALSTSAKGADTLADAEDAHIIKSTLANLIKLTLETKMAQFEELDGLLDVWLC